MKIKVRDPDPRERLELEEKFQFLLETANFEIGGETKPLPRFDALFKTATQQAALGDIAANTDLDRLQSALQPQAVGGLIVSPSQNVADARRRSALESAYSTLPICIVYLMLLPEVKEVFRKSYGDDVQETDLMPYVLSFYDDEMKKAKAEIESRMRKDRRELSRGVGRGKHSSTTWFKPEHPGNPTGRRKRESSFLDCLVEARLADVSIRKADGTTMKISKKEAGFRQRFKKALAGNVKARGEWINLIIAMNKAGMLKPENVEVRKAAKNVETNRDLCRVYETRFVASIKRELVVLYTTRFGPVDEFITDYERSLPPDPLKEAARALAKQLRKELEREEPSEEMEAV